MTLFIAKYIMLSGKDGLFLGTPERSAVGDDDDLKDGIRTCRLTWLLDAKPLLSGQQGLQRA